jgi:hypothetical protein
MMLHDQLVVNIAVGLPFFVIGFFVAPAFGYISEPVRAGRVSLRDVRDAADSSVGEPRPRVRATRRQMSSNDSLLLIGLVGIVVVQLFDTYRVQVILGLLVVSAVLVLAACSSLVVMSRRGVVAPDMMTRVTFLALFALFGVGVFVAAMVRRPLALSTQGVQSGEVQGLERLLALAYQVVGALAFAGVAFAGIAFSVAVIASLNLYVGAWGKWLSTVLYRRTSGVWSAQMFFVGLFASVVALLFASGVAYEWVASTDPTDELLTLPSG